MKLILILCIVSTISGCKNSEKIKIVTSLPSIINEVSGIAVSNDPAVLWMVNDSGNAPVVYRFDVPSKKIVQTIVINNATNVDWEDLATDSKGNLFIGDFGNNISKRKNQVIYTIKKNTEIQHDTTETLKTSFHFEDQTKFPPKKKNRTFDVEAFLIFNQHFYLFTRNRSTHFDGTTKVYKLPVKEGHFKATLIATYKTCDDSKTCQITGATIHHQSGKIALLSYNKVWILDNYDEDRFFEGNIKEINLGFRSQKESIAFKNATELYIADERSGTKGGNLYVLKI